MIYITPRRLTSVSITHNSQSFLHSKHILFGSRSHFSLFSFTFHLDKR